MSSDEVEVVPYTTEAGWMAERAKDVTSTESAALFGLSPYLTPFELWHRKRAGAVLKFEPTERMKWGSRLQDAIALGIAEDQGWRVVRDPDYRRLTDLRMGASIDYRMLEAPGREGLLEVKNVDSLEARDGWIVEGDEIEAPPHIEMQVQHQLAVTGAPFAYIGALVGGNRVLLIRREPAKGIIQAIIAKVEAFWTSIERGQEPAPDFKRDAKFIHRLYSEVEPGRVVDLADDPELQALALGYHASGEQIRECQAKRDEIKARILTKVGTAEKAIGSNCTINAGTVKATRVEAYDRAAFRNFRVTVKKNKEK